MTERHIINIPDALWELARKFNRAHPDEQISTWLKKLLDERMLPEASTVVVQNPQNLVEQGDNEDYGTLITARREGVCIFSGEKIKIGDPIFIRENPRTKRKEFFHYHCDPFKDRRM